MTAEQNPSNEDIRRFVAAELARRAALHAELEQDALFGAEAIARAIGLSARTVRHYHLKKLLPTFKVGRKIVARRSGLAAWLAKREAAAAPTEA